MKKINGRWTLLTLVLVLVAGLTLADTGVTRRTNRPLVVATADQGYVIFPFHTHSGATTNLISVVDKVRAFQRVLKERLTVRVIQISVITFKPGSRVGVGIYSADKNTLLLESGPIITTSNGKKKVTLSTPVILEPGVYWYAWTANRNDLNVYGADGVSSMDRLFDDTNPQMGNAANSGSNGVLPATLGTITYASFDIPFSIMKP